MNGGPAADRAEGSASLWVVAFAMVLWVFAAAVVVAGGAVAARHRAASAADLSALAGAAALSQPPTDAPAGGIGELGGIGEPAALACAKAKSVATANDARLVSCAVDGSVLTVVAAVPIRGLARVAAHNGEVTARARAGPG